MALIDKDELIKQIHGTSFVEGDDRSIVLSVIERMPKKEATNVSELFCLEEKCERYENAIVKMAVMLMKKNV